MRNLLIFAVLAFFTFGAFGRGSFKSKILQLPDGVLSADIYSNDALGLRYEIPNGWTVTADPKGPVGLDYRKPDGLANRCTKVLLRLDAPHPKEGRFNSIATLLAIDPGCFPGTEFPYTWKEKEKIEKVTDKIIKAFENSPYFSPYSVTIFADRSRKDHVIIRLTGGVIINAINEIDGHPSPMKEPLTVNTSFALAETKGYWVAWAYLADYSSTEVLKNVKITFKDDPSQ